MAKAKPKFTVKPAWGLTDLVRYLCTELGYEPDHAVGEIYKAIIIKRLDLWVQEFIGNVPEGDAVKVDPFDFRIDCELKFNPPTRRVFVVAKYNESKWQELAPFVFHVSFPDRRYTIDEQAARRLWPPPSDAAAEQQPEDKADPDSDEPSNSKEWITAEVYRMIREGEKIPQGPRGGPRPVAELLANRMGKAKTDKPLHPVKWQHIANNLSGWGLWPIESIKLP
jgi:hypothetical protein